MAKKPKEKREPEIVTGLRLLDMAYGGEVVARLNEAAQPLNLPNTLDNTPGETADIQPQSEEEGEFQPLNEPVSLPESPSAPAASQVVFVAGGLPGEVVDVQLYRRKKSFLKANVLKVVEAAPEREEAPCPYFGLDKWPNCGGCQWQHASYDAQLQYKHRIFRDQLVRLGGYHNSEPPLLPPVGARSAWGYRNNVEFQVDEQSGRPSFHRQNSIRLVPVQSCHISHPLITLAIEPLTAALQKHLPKRVHQVTLRVGPVSGDSRVSAEEITALAPYNTDQTARQGAEERFLAYTPLEIAMQPTRPTLLMVLRMLGEWSVNDLKPFVADLEEALDKYCDITVYGEGRKRRLESPSGAPNLTEVLHGVTYQIPPLAFFQSNSPMAEVLISQAMSAFEVTGLNFEKSRLMDIYCGVGTFSLQMAKRGAQVFGIEEYEGAVTGASENARLNGLEKQCQFVAAKAEEYILQLEERGEHFDGALLDPPRRGCDPALLQSLLKTRPPVLVYVSCDPSTLARDIKILSEGYELIQTRVIDLFPQTYHMESVSLLKAR
ncbi:MAG TPA: class I SAM-dependent RNA methyltransferase [Chloroflexia bacterium]|nr:class I SAM-dependent RNA methyltransferase [Chloroflexia bacterium]